MSDWSDIGTSLRDTRNGLGWSLQDVAHRTRIPIANLHALEENDYSPFASPAYAKSFLAQYSDYLGIDATEWLDAFDTGNVFADLDSYEYLKDHDERLGEELPAVPAKKEPRLIRRRVREPRPEEATAMAPSRDHANLQPLVVFLITAMLITGAVLGFRHLSANLGADADEAASPEVTDSRRDLQPVSNIPDSRPDLPDMSNAPRAVPTSAEAPPLVVAADPIPSRPLNNSPAGDGGSAVPLLPDAPPPRAIIIEE